MECPPKEAAAWKKAEVFDPLFHSVAAHREKLYVLALGFAGARDVQVDLIDNKILVLEMIY